MAAVRSKVQQVLRHATEQVSTQLRLLQICKIQLLNITQASPLITAMQPQTLTGQYAYRYKQRLQRRVRALGAVGHLRMAMRPHLRGAARLAQALDYHRPLLRAQRQHSCMCALEQQQSQA